MVLKWKPSELSLILNKIPLPPSENRLFMNIPKFKNQRCRIKTKEYRSYIEEFQIWELQNRLQLFPMKKALETHSKIELHFTMYFPHGAVYCKDGRIKRLDIQNRLKAICDLLCKALGIDDSAIFKVSAEKRRGEPGVTAHMRVLETFGEVS